MCLYLVQLRIVGLIGSVFCGKRGVFTCVFVLAEPVSSSRPVMRCFSDCLQSRAEYCALPTDFCVEVGERTLAFLRKVTYIVLKWYSKPRTRVMWLRRVWHGNTHLIHSVNGDWLVQRKNESRTSCDDRCAVISASTEIPKKTFRRILSSPQTRERFCRYWISFLLYF